MPTLSNGTDSLEVEAGTSLVEAAEKLGIPFSCTQGNCGTCLTQILEGKENLSDYTEAEKDFGLEEDERLMCQVKIMEGRVVVED